ncbi:hypothetical protein TTHERM_00616060 (macronuclear) [Tetrahymena thermophila SB210]|uniref:Uncharacterized protein n=1 Tax=Tetrahymena thermophila (strain SB210) TaxID=312017 RepID=I7MIH3_TETTS|nr:hypothetical protein TTHERM_00616060 [Tetrahymena thermophila SB210]EAS04431.2 hypothetical protein TTHERM_00616060 [Tetrahymena thermophila SB210]|eukprot:XP_001024676.2 hypothetical protein TTHERM_00616060 [Tetrahymena thermophila SB210]
MFQTPQKKQAEYPVFKVEQLNDNLNSSKTRFPSMKNRGQENSPHKQQIFALKHIQSQPQLSSKIPNHPFLPSSSKQKLDIFKNQNQFINNEKKQNTTRKAGATILTVAQTLQNQYIANKIDVDLGTLNEFLDDDVKVFQSQSNSQKLKFKKLGKSPYSKFDISNNKNAEGDNQDKVNQDDNDEEKEYDLKKSKYLNPLEILKNEDDEKKRQFAAKVIIQQLFKANYGDDIEKLEEQNALELYKLRNQDDLLEQDTQLTKFLKKNARKTLKEKLKILQEQLDDQTATSLGNNIQGFQLSSQANNQGFQQGQKGINKSVKINDLNESKKRKIAKDDDFNYFENQDTSRNEEDGKGLNKQSINSQQTLSLSRNDSQYLKSQQGKNKYIKNQSVMQESNIPIYQQQQNVQNLRNSFNANKNQLDYRYNYIMDLKFRNIDVTQLWVQYGCENEGVKQQNDKLYRDYIEAQLKFYPMYFKRNKNFEYYKERKKKVQFTDSDYEEVQKEYQEYPKEEILIIDQNQITSWNQKIESTFIMFFTLNYSHFHTLQKIELFKTQLKEDGILVLLEAAQKECQNLKYLTLSYNKIGARALIQINKLITQFQLSVLGLRCVEMSTKQFCQLCICMAENQSIIDLDVSENQLDERAIEAIKTIIRYIKNLVKLNVSKNSISEQKYKEIKKQMYDLIKNKEVIFF